VHAIHAKRFVGECHRRGAKRCSRDRGVFFLGVSSAIHTDLSARPAWFGLPMETQAALTTLMTRLILNHADKRRMGSTRDGHDL
jgi:hypothetical protein